MPRIRKLFHSNSALGIFLHMEEILATALGRKLAAHRESGISSAAAFARIEELEHRLRLLERWIELYVARFSRIAILRRFQWAPEERFEMLTLKRAERLSSAEAARRASVSPSTIHRWEAEARAHPERRSVGSLLKAIPPIRRISDDVRRMVQEIDAMKLLGARSIAQHLARASLRISATTIRRIRKEPQPPDAALCGAGESRAPHVDRPIRARYPRHIYMLDLTSVRGWLGVFDFKIALLIDAYARFPLEAKVFTREPSAPEIQAFLQAAFDRHGPPKILITDHGSAFTSAVVDEFLESIRVDHRLGAVGQSGSIALIERTFRTLKGLLSVTFCPRSRSWSNLRGVRAVAFRPLVAEDLAGPLETALAYYARHRPHQGLGGATPDEIFFGERPKHLDAIRAPRGQPGQASDPVPIDIRFLDRAERLPFLVRTDDLAEAA